MHCIIKSLPYHIYSSLVFTTLMGKCVKVSTCAVVCKASILRGEIANRLETIARFQVYHVGWEHNHTFRICAKFHKVKVAENTLIIVPYGNASKSVNLYCHCQL